ncbi:hypothetical protein DFH06DRAFT_1347709 [Mycena polygramma]|nr:hypothetical protein DFH06DRAFT_1347709 [Mycena polygramma]
MLACPERSASIHARVDKAAPRPLADAHRTPSSPTPTRVLALSMCGIRILWPVLRSPTALVLHLDRRPQRRVPGPIQSSSGPHPTPTAASPAARPDHGGDGARSARGPNGVGVDRLGSGVSRGSFQLREASRTQTLMCAAASMQCGANTVGRRRQTPHGCARHASSPLPVPLQSTDRVASVVPHTRRQRGPARICACRTSPRPAPAPSACNPAADMRPRTHGAYLPLIDVHAVSLLRGGRVEGTKEVACAVAQRADGLECMMDIHGCASRAYPVPSRNKGVQVHAGGGGRVREASYSSSAAHGGMDGYLMGTAAGRRRMCRPSAGIIVTPSTPFPAINRRDPWMARSTPLLHVPTSACRTRADPACLQPKPYSPPTDAA